MTALVVALMGVLVIQSVTLLAFVVVAMRNRSSAIAWKQYADKLWTRVVQLENELEAAVQDRRGSRS